MRVDWEAGKAAANLARHGVAFEEAQTVFGDPLATTIFDADHSHDEDRFITTGFTQKGRLVVVWHTDRQGAVRIIGARDATQRAEDI